MAGARARLRNLLRGVLPRLHPAIRNRPRRAPRTRRSGRCCIGGPGEGPGHYPARCGRFWGPLRPCAGHCARRPARRCPGLRASARPGRCARFRLPPACRTQAGAGDAAAPGLPPAGAATWPARTHCHAARWPAPPVMAAPPEACTPKFAPRTSRQKQFRAKMLSPRSKLEVER
jgi:hypothetical protein